MALTFRTAQDEDLVDLIDLLVDDDIGAGREDPSIPPNARYVAAFQMILESPDNEILIAERNGELAGILQLTYIPNLSRLGSRRCQVEGVRVARPFRGQGIGGDLLRESINRARQHGCSLVQLTSDKSRSDALRFYESLGFVASHVGFKLTLD